MNGLRRNCELSLSSLDFDAKGRIGLATDLAIIHLQTGSCCQESGFSLQRGMIAISLGRTSVGSICNKLSAMLCGVPCAPKPYASFHAESRTAGARMDEKWHVRTQPDQAAALPRCQADVADNILSKADGPPYALSLLYR